MPYTHRHEEDGCPRRFEIDTRQYETTETQYEAAQALPDLRWSSQYLNTPPIPFSQTARQNASAGEPSPDRSGSNRSRMYYHS